MPKSKKNLQARLIDLSFLLLSAGCFGFFVWNSTHVQTLNSGEPIAKLSYGTVERKRAGMVTFVEISPGASLYHRDALWVGEGRSARIEFVDQALVGVKEKTFLVLERRTGTESIVNVLTGTASLLPDSKTYATVKSGTPFDPNASYPPELVYPNHTPPSDAKPAPGSTEEAARKERDVNPKPNLTIYLASGKPSHDITFGWPKPLSGVLVLSVKQGTELKEVARHPFENLTFFKMNVKADAQYQWSILAAPPSGSGSGSGRILKGPFDFTLTTQGIENIKIGAGDDTDHPIEIIQ